MVCRRDVGWFRPELPPTASEPNRGIGSANVKRALNCNDLAFFVSLLSDADLVAKRNMRDLLAAVEECWENFPVERMDNV